jgi:hypothetical protein
MSKLTYFIISLVLLTACNGNPGKTDTQPDSVNYKTYHNDRYDYTVEYPDFLIPQGEADSGDGQKFISEDQKIQLIVYHEFKDDPTKDGEPPSVEKAYAEDLAFITGVLSKKLEDNHYIIKYKVDNMLHTDYTVFNDRYFTIRFEYPEEENDRMEGVIEHIINSFKLEVLDYNANAQNGNASSGEPEDKFPAFIEGFLNDCYWGKNFSSLLKNNDKTLANYLDSKMDVRRYYASGTVAILATRAEDFGFAPEDDFMSKPSATGDLIFEYVNDFDNSTPCDLIYSNINVIYYVRIKSVPDVVVNTETFETRPVKIAYPEAEIMAVYLSNSYGNPRGFYFINTPDGWKLAFVDDSLCEA